MVAEAMWWVGCGGYVVGVGGKMIPRIRLTSAKDLVEVEAELGKKWIRMYVTSIPQYNIIICDFLLEEHDPQLPSSQECQWYSPPSPLDYLSDNLGMIR